MAKDWQFRYKNAKKKELVQEFASWGNDDLINHIMELRSVIDEMQKEINAGNDQAGKEGENKALSEADYKQGWSYPTKIAFMLTILHKPLTSEEVHKLLLKLDTHYKDYKVPRNNLTVTLNRTIKSGRVKKIKVPGIRSLYYALPEWLDKDGNLAPRFGSVVNPFQ
jgi:hypothetical protein